MGLARVAEESTWRNSARSGAVGLQEEPLGMGCKQRSGVWVRSGASNAVLALVARYLQLSLADSKTGIIRGKFKQPEGYDVDLICYYIAPPISFLDSTDNPLDSANVDKIHIDFNEEDVNEEDFEE